MRWFPTVFAFLLIAFLANSCRTIEDKGVLSGKMTQTQFASADLDSDGKLTKKEAATHLHQEALAEFDLDNDSHISASEWAAARPSAGESEPHFNNLDKNDDGRVAQDEAVQFITDHVNFGDQFKDLDENGDFHLHWEEIDAGAPTSLNVTLFSIHPDA